MGNEPTTETLQVFLASLGTCTPIYSVLLVGFEPTCYYYFAVVPKTTVYSSFTTRGFFYCRK